MVLDWGKCPSCWKHVKTFLLYKGGDKRIRLTRDLSPLPILFTGSFSVDLPRRSKGQGLLDVDFSQTSRKGSFPEKPGAWNIVVWSI
jgi:hypothetical protein